MEGKQRKSRVVTKVNTQDAFSEFLQTFVGPLLASIGFLALLIYASKRVSEMEAIKKLMGMLDTVKKVAEGEVPTEIGEVPVPDISIDGSGGSGGGDGFKEKMAEMASDKLNEAAETACDEAGNTLEKAIEKIDDPQGENGEEKKDPYLWRFTAWQVIWVRLLPPLLTWATFCSVTAAGAGKVSAITSSYAESVALVSCLVYQNNTGNGGTWWENPYAACALSTNATALYTSNTPPSGTQLCSWPLLAELSSDLKSAINYGKWAYATPIITCILTIFVLSGAFILHDANKKNVSGSAVARKWTDVQLKIKWKKPLDAIKAEKDKEGVSYYWPFEKFTVTDFYAIERVSMDETMILYLPVELQNHIRKTERLIVAHCNEFGIDASKPSAELVELAKSRTFSELEQMYAELDKFLIHYSTNPPSPPPPPPNTEDKKAMAAHAKIMRKFKNQKQGVDSAIKQFVDLRNDLDAVKTAMTARMATLDKASNEGKALTDATLKAGLQLIVAEFKNYLEQFKNPNRNRGRNIFLSIGPQTLLRGGIPGSPTEIPTQSISLLLATITFANNYFCDNLVATVTTAYSTTSPFQPGCPPALVSWVTNSLVALSEFSKTGGLAAIAVFLGLVNSVVTITTLMGKQINELIKRIETRGADLMAAASNTDEPPPSCVDTCFPRSKYSQVDGGVATTDAMMGLREPEDEDVIEVTEITTSNGEVRMVNLATNEVVDDEGVVLGTYNPRSNTVAPVIKKAPTTEKTSNSVASYIDEGDSSGLVGGSAQSFAAEAAAFPLHIVNIPVEFVSTLICGTPQQPSRTKRDWTEAATQEDLERGAAPKPAPAAPKAKKKSKKTQKP